MVFDIILDMKKTLEPPLNKIESLKDKHHLNSVSVAEYIKENTALRGLLTEWEDKYQRLLEQFKLSQHTRFGKSSEAHPEQGQLFNEAEAILESEHRECHPVLYSQKI